MGRNPSQPGTGRRAVVIKADFTAGSALAEARDEQTIETQKCHSWQRLLEICSLTYNSPWAAARSGTGQPDFCPRKASRDEAPSPSTRA